MPPQGVRGEGVLAGSAGAAGGRHRPAPPGHQPKVGAAHCRYKLGVSQWLTLHSPGGQADGGGGAGGPAGPGQGGAQAAGGRPALQGRSGHYTQMDVLL